MVRMEPVGFRYSGEGRIEEITAYPSLPTFHPWPLYRIVKMKETMRMYQQGQL
jgi:hypothetical protein